MFIYRTKKYKETKKQIDSLKKKIELNKENIKGKNKQLDKKLKKRARLICLCLKLAQEGCTFAVEKEKKFNR